MTDLRKRIQQLPKADFHHHLHLGGDIQKLKSKYEQPDFSVPRTYDGLQGMILFIEQELNSLIRSPEDAIHLMETAIQSALEDNVVYLEASVDMRLSRYFDNSIEPLIETIDMLRNKYSSQLEFRPDIGINKDLPQDMVYHIATECIQSGVFSGIDIYGKEDGKNLAEYLEIYGLARKANLKTKVHIGEFSNADTIDKAIELLEPEVIQHGIRAIEDEKTMNTLGQMGIQLNICPQSNIALGAAESIQDHPLRELYDRDIKVTINTDDYLLFGASITDQYLELIEKGVFEIEEVEELNLRSLDFAKKL